MPTVNDYIEARSSFDILDSKTITLVSMAELEIGNSYNSDDLRNKAVALLTMHWLLLPMGGVSTSAIGSKIQSQREGDLFISYETDSSKTTFKNDYLSLTVYGIELMQLNNSCFFKPRTRAFDWLT